MKICIDIRSFLIPKTGVGHYTNNLIHSLLKIDPHNEYHLFYFNFFRKKHNFNFPAPNSFLREIKLIPGRACNFIWRYLDYPKIDSLLGTMDLFHFPNFTSVPNKAGKNIITIHDLSFIRLPQYTEPKNLKYLTKHFLKSLNKADLILADSQFTKNEIIDIFNVSPQKIKVVYLGVDSLFREKGTVQKIAEVKKKYNLPPHYLFYVGTLEPRKNIPTILKAYKIFKDRRPDLPHKLVLVGIKGWLYDQIFTDIQKLKIENDTLITGYVEQKDLPLIYQGGETLLYPSFYEGFGLPILEAQASSIPVICSKEASIPEVGGNAAVYVETKNSEEIAAKIEKIISDNAFRKEIITQGLEQSQKFSWEKTAKRTLSLYEKIESA